MKNFLAVFDGYKLCKSTFEYAILMAKVSQSRLTGVFLDPFFYHNYNLSKVVKVSTDFEKDLTELNEKDQRQRDQTVADFQKLCEEAHIEYAVHRKNSIALQELEQESLFADLVIINEGEKFKRHDDRKPTGFITEILSDLHCPIVVVPDNFKSPEKIVFLYDGSPASIDAIKTFSYIFENWKDVPIDVVSVNEGNIENGYLPGNTLMIDLVERYFSNSNYQLLKGNAKEQIMAYLSESNENHLIILGAYRRNKFSRWLKPSLADVLMNELDQPLFITH